MSSYFFEDLEVGMQASHEKTVSASDIPARVFPAILIRSTWMSYAVGSSSPVLPTAC
jgi:hypothetical protein